MKATDLRIGNLVTLNDKVRNELWHNQIRAHNNFFEVKTIYSDNNVSLELDDEIVDMSENDIEGIPLNENWLWALGAEKNYETYIYDRFKLIWKEAYKYWYVVDKESLNYLTKVRFVHEWQNFVYAMNSIELKFSKKNKICMENKVENLIVEWLKSGDENATNLTHKICVLLKNMDLYNLKKQ